LRNEKFRKRQKFPQNPQKIHRIFWELEKALLFLHAKTNVFVVAKLKVRKMHSIFLHQKSSIFEVLQP